MKLIIDITLRKHGKKTITILMFLAYFILGYFFQSGIAICGFGCHIIPHWPYITGICIALLLGYMSLVKEIK